VLTDSITMQIRNGHESVIEESDEILDKITKRPENLEDLHNVKMFIESTLEVRVAHIQATIDSFKERESLLQITMVMLTP